MASEEKAETPPTEDAAQAASFDSQFKDMPESQLAVQCNKLQQTKMALIGKINDLEVDRREHKLVLETFQDVPEDRRCFRMIGGVMVERTVKEVKPVIEAHERAVGKAIEMLEKELEAKSKEHAYLAARLAPQTARQAA